MKVALAVTRVLVAVEFIAGRVGHSLALVTDGWHNLSDVPSLALAWVALYFGRKPPDHQRTYGYQRAGVLAAFVNALLLSAVAVYICIEGYTRIVRPQAVSAPLMLGVGLAALVINGSSSLVLSGGREDLNLRAVFIHNLGDALSNLGIIAGAWLISRTGQLFIDPLLAFLIAGMILWSALGIVAESADILLESAPKGMGLVRVANVILGVPGVREVHDIHIWSLGSQSHALSCHVRIFDMPTSESERIAQSIRQVLADEFDIDHTTVQFEHTHPPGEFHRYMPSPSQPAQK